MSNPVPVDNLQVVQVLNGKYDLQHPPGNEFFGNESLHPELPLQVVLQIPLLAVFLDDIGPPVLLDEFVEGDHVGVGQPPHEGDLLRWEILHAWCADR